MGVDTVATGPRGCRAWTNAPRSGSAGGRGGRRLAERPPRQSTSASFRPSNLAGPTSGPSSTTHRPRFPQRHGRTPSRATNSPTSSPTRTGGAPRRSPGRRPGHRARAAPKQPLRSRPRARGRADEVGSSETVTRWANTGRLTSIRTLGGQRRFREDEVLAALNATDDARRVQGCRAGLGRFT